MTRRIFLQFSLAVALLSDGNTVKDTNIDFYRTSACITPEQLRLMYYFVHILPEIIKIFIVQIILTFWRRNYFFKF